MALEPLVYLESIWMAGLYQVEKVVGEKLISQIILEPKDMKVKIFHTTDTILLPKHGALGRSCRLFLPNTLPASLLDFCSHTGCTIGVAMDHTRGS